MKEETKTEITLQTISTQLENIERRLEEKNHNEMQAGLVLLPAPVMSPERFSDETGYGCGVVRSWIKKGLIPSQRIGKHRVVDLVAMAASSIELSKLPGAA